MAHYDTHSTTPQPPLRPLELITASWQGDLAPFRQLREALSRSQLSAIPHRVAVHTEDLEAFSAIADASMALLPTADVLPSDLDRQRQVAVRLQARFGRTLTKWMTSTTRYGWPRWVRAIGWQMQQITKLQMVATSDAALAVVLDSDVIPTRRARPTDFETPDGALTYYHPVPADSLSGKTAKWNLTAHRLMTTAGTVTPSDDHFDTPFPMSPDLVRLMLSWMTKRYRMPWWEVLLRQPPRRWSEFATYRAFLYHHVDPTKVVWSTPSTLRYLYADSADREQLKQRVQSVLDDPGCNFVTIHSQASGKRFMDPAVATDAIAPLIARHFAES